MINKLEKLEALRGLAAFYVLLHKYYLGGVNIYNIFRFGQEAVILFFLLSGFVIKYSIEVSGNKSFQRYFFRRFLRLYIPLILVLVIGYLVVSHKNGFLVSVDFPNLIGNLFMLQDWAKVKPHVFFDPYLGNNPLWSLAYEWWFYMLFFPLTIFINNESTRNLLVLSISVLSAVAYVGYPYFPVRIIMYFAIWWAGAMLAEGYLKDRNFGIGTMMVPIVALLLIVTVLAIDVALAAKTNQKLTLGFHPILELRHFSFAILSAFAWRHIKWAAFNSLVKPFIIVAPISYTIYILHWHIMIDGAFLDFIVNPIARWFGYLTILLALAYLIEIIIYPFIKNRFSKLIR
jgi:peptidoglycan/LPS O-acetylase OafA/YrhL